MEDSERKFLYVQSCFEVLGRPLPLDGVKVDIIRAMGLLSIYAAQGAIPDYKTWEASTFGPDPKEQEEEPETIPWPAEAEVSWAKAQGYLDEAS